METPNKASSTLLERLRKDTEHADVDLVFEGGVVLTAHANVLALASDYYKEALSEKWTHGRHANESYETGICKGRSKLSPKANKGQAATKSTCRKITLRHADVDAETAKIVLDYLYLGDADIPPSLVSSLIAFADEILVVSLVQKCVDYLVNENKLSSEHALECYVQFDRVHAHVNSKSYALSKMQQNLPYSLECGRGVLAQMNEKDVETLLLFERLEPLDRWRILIAWCKACQNTPSDLSLESKLPQGFRIITGSELIEPLLAVVELIKIPAIHANLLEPFQVLLPKFAQDMLAFHWKRKTRSGGNQWKATHQSLMEIMREIKRYLPVALPVSQCCCRSGSLVSWKTRQKHRKGPVRGIFFTNEWSSYSRRGVVHASFMFVVGPNGPFRILPFGYLSHGPPNSCGLNLSWFMKEFAKTAETHKDIFSGFGDGERCAFIRQLSAVESDCGAIEYIAVYHIN
ncbi:hypothetical protein BJ741DRAFT_655336 [Chytriomyces cf. hyalinus JEL632]|nr:hypothetical protein BJ741DRAFT_655336 [Chytriomyces cf. hyalinus JEL632]